MLYKLIPCLGIVFFKDIFPGKQDISWKEIQEIFISVFFGKGIEKDIEKNCLILLLLLISLYWEVIGKVMVSGKLEMKS